MKRERYWGVHALFVLLVALIVLAPEQKAPESALFMANPGGSSLSSAHPGMFLAVACLLEVLCVWRIRRGRDPRAAADIGALLFGVLVLWELCTTTLGWGHAILCPRPEAVFDVFRTRWELMLRGIGSSLELLGIGFLTALPLGIVTGALAACTASRCRWRESWRLFRPSSTRRTSSRSCPRSVLRRLWS